MRWTSHAGFRVGRVPLVPPAPIIKSYAPRGPLTQYRLEFATPFLCFRCGQQKKSKLVVVYDSDWSRLLCNACYGYLLSIHEIAAGTGPDEEKANQLAELLVGLVSADAARGALRRRTYTCDPETNLSTSTVRFLGTAEFVADRLQDQSSLEWSPAIICLCKAVEFEVVARIMEPLRRQCAQEDLAHDLADNDLKRLARWCAGKQPQQPELGGIRHVLVTAANSRRRAEASPLIRALLQRVRTLPRGGWLLDTDGLARALGELTMRFRNPAAHTDELDAPDYASCRELVLAADGLLWRLVDATSP